MNINDINHSVKKHKRRRRRGRGAASGLGKTSGFGQKGLGARSGANRLKGFVGGQSTLMTRLPKRGFNNAVFRTEYLPVDVAFLEAKFENGAEVDLEALSKCGITLRRGDRVKILGSGEISKGLKVKVNAFSRSAREKIEKAGGSVEVVAQSFGKRKADTAEAGA